MPGPSDRKRRRKVPRRKLVKRPKIRGRYRPKTSEDASSHTDNENSHTENHPGIDDVMTPILPAKLVECVLSDDEEKAACLEEITTTSGHLYCQHVDEPDNASVSSGKKSFSGKISDGDSVSSASVDHSYSRHASAQCAYMSRSPELYIKADPSLSIYSPDVSHDYILSDSAVLKRPSCDATSQSVSVQSAENASVVSTDQSSLTLDTDETLPLEIDTLLDLVEYIPSTELINFALSMLQNLLKLHWFPMVDRFGFHLLWMSHGVTKAIQRQVSISFLGEARIIVHCQPLPFASTLLSCVELPQVKLEENTVEDFCKRANNIAQIMSRYKICQGANYKRMRKEWGNIVNTSIDTNPYQERSYDETCRSLSCCLLVKLEGRTVRCHSCDKVLKSLKTRSHTLLSDSPHPMTANVYLSRQQILDKLQAQSEELKKTKGRIVYLTGKISSLEDKEVDGGVDDGVTE